MTSRRELLRRVVGTGAAAGLGWTAGCGSTSVDDPGSGNREYREQSVAADDPGPVWPPDRQTPLVSEWVRTFETDGSDYLESVEATGGDLLAAGGVTWFEREGGGGRSQPWVLGVDGGGTPKWHYRPTLPTLDVEEEDRYAGWYVSDLAAVDGDLLVGLNWYLESSAESTAAQVARLAPDGTERWRVRTGTTGAPSVAAVPPDATTGPSIYVTLQREGAAGELLALTAEGTLRWRRTVAPGTTGQIADVRAATDGAVYVAVTPGDDEGELPRILAVDRAGSLTGVRRFEFDRSEVEYYDSMRTTADGSLVTLDQCFMNCGTTVSKLGDEGDVEWRREFGGWGVTGVVTDRRHAPLGGAVLTMKRKSEGTAVVEGARLTALRADGRTAWLAPRQYPGETPVDFYWQFEDAAVGGDGLFVGATVDRWYRDQDERIGLVRYGGGPTPR